MKIAVLMSVCNPGKYLIHQLDSLCGQTLRRQMTVYVREDGAGNGTAARLLGRYRSRLDLRFRSGTRLGAALSFWSMLMDPAIQADYFAFCDQDDVWDTDKLEQAVCRLKDSAQLCACNCRLMDGTGRILQKKRLTEPPQITLRRLFVAGVTQGCSMVFTRALRQHLMELQLQAIPMHDLLVQMYALSFGGVCWDPVPRFGYRLHAANADARQNKSWLGRIRTTAANWKPRPGGSLAEAAEEMLQKQPGLSEQDRDFLQQLCRYRQHRAELIRQSREIPVEPSALRSFQLRILLGIY